MKYKCLFLLMNNSFHESGVKMDNTVLEEKMANESDGIKCSKRGLLKEKMFVLMETLI